MSSALPRPHLTRGLASAIAVLACGLLVTTTSPTYAAVTYDDTAGTGFVGKGDVQTAFGWNDAKVQQLATSVSFSAGQPATQTLSSTATQDATQVGTVEVTRSVSCVIEGKKKEFTDFGTRSGERSGTRTGTRSGTRAGTLSGILSSEVVYDTRKNNLGKVTGFLLLGYAPGTQPTFVAQGEEDWADPVFEGDYVFGAYAWGEIAWSGWVKGEGSDGQPSDCLRTDSGADNGPTVTDLSDSTVNGTPLDGDLTEGAPTFGTTSVMSTEPTGPATVFVTYGSSTVSLN